MTGQREEALIVARHAWLAGLRQVVAREDQAARRSVLEPAIAVAGGQSQEPVAVERRGPAEEVDLRLADLLQIGGNALEVGFEAPGHHETVRHARGLELHALEIGDLDGMVEQLVVVGRRVATEAFVVDVDGLERRRDAPGFAERVPRPLEIDLDGLAVAAFRQQEQARSVEIAAPPVEIRAAHGLVERVDGDRDGELVLRPAHDPGAAVDLLDRQSSSAAHGADRHDLAREVAEKVAARDPRRQRQALLRGGTVDSTFDLEMMAVEVRQTDAIPDQGESSALVARIVAENRDGLLFRGAGSPGPKQWREKVARPYFLLSCGQAVPHWA